MPRCTVSTGMTPDREGENGCLALDEAESLALRDHSEQDLGCIRVVLQPDIEEAGVDNGLGWCPRDRWHALRLDLHG